MSPEHRIPSILIFAGHDPSGGAGIQADIEAVASQGTHPATVITALTEQDTGDVARVSSTDATAIADQARRLWQDLDIRAVKIGLTGNQEIAATLAGLLNEHPEVPVILDPVLRSGGGKAALGAAEQLAPLLGTTTLLTPNGPEARKLSGCEDLDQAAAALTEQGCEYVLITGGHENDSDTIDNRLYNQDGLLETFPWPRLPHEYHGSGCTLASAIAGLLAQGSPLRDAVYQAQEYTWQTLKQAYVAGRGQRIPNRLFWARHDH